MSLLASLNARQREAVLHGEGPLLVIAGAGSGKTRVVVTRIAYLILEKGIAPKSVLAVTFTNKAADEMRERVVQLLEEHGLHGTRKPLVSTFHSFCVRLLRQYGASLAAVRKGFTPRFLILDAKDQLAVVKEVCRELGLGERAVKPAHALAAISRAKNAGRMRIGSRDSRDPMTRSLNDVYEAYEASLLESNALDFDDLLLEAVALLRHDPRITESVRSRYRYLLIDEYQDTNRPQYELMRLLAEPRRNVCVVGDEDQAIYSWRGADIGNILGFESDYPAARVIRLEQNYRSTQRILDAASAVIEHNDRRKGKRLWSSGPAGELPALYQAWDGRAEARYVARAMGEILDRDPEARVGVLYRTNAQSRLIEEAFRREGREFLVVGGVAFYQRREVKDLLAYIKAAVSPDDSVSLQRIINVPARGIGKMTLQRLRDYASREGVSLWRAIEETVERRLLPKRARTALQAFRQLMVELRARLDADDCASLLAWVYDRSGYRDMLEVSSSAESEARIENIKELGVAASEASKDGASLHEFLDYAALVSDSDGIDQLARVQLMTLHTAKGLEFPAVAIVGMEESLFPHQRSIASEGDALEEERRLFYVGMTRARRHLLLTCAGRRSLYGAGDPQRMEPSRFLDEIPPELLDDRSPAAWGGTHDRGRAFSEVPEASGAASPLASGLSAEPDNGATQIATHDSVSAVADFFKQRGIQTDIPTRPASAAAGVPAAAGAPIRRRSRRSKPRLGQALKTLRRQGPFASGTRVRHKKFGVGVVRRREGEGPTAKLSVYFKNHGMKKLVAGYANLSEV